MKQFVVPNVLAVTTAIVFVACRVLVGLFPGPSLAIAQSWLHSVQVRQTGAWNLTFSSFVLGLISSTITAWVIGYIYIRVSKALAK